MEDIRTEEYYIGYVDMLGSHNKIVKDKNGYWLKEIKRLYDDALYQVKNLKEVFDRQTPSIIIFSDNIVIAVKIPKDKNDINGLLFILYFLSYFQTKAFLEHKWLCRGCVTKGNLYIQEPNFENPVSFIWGEGLVNAHLGESKIAFYPRIIIDKSIKIKDSIFKSQKFFFKDSDGITCLNYLESYILTYKLHEIDGTLNVARDSLNQLKKDSPEDDEISNKKINQKISWTEKYINRVDDDYDYMEHRYDFVYNKSKVI